MKLDRRPCPICGQFNDTVLAEENIDAESLTDFAYASRKYPEYMHLRLMICPSCTVVYADPAPSAVDLSQEYQKAAFDSSREARYAARTYAHYLPWRCKPARALDVGCGSGEFLEILHKRGVRDLYGIEPSLQSADMAVPELRPSIHIGIFEAGMFEPEQFDLVSSFQTLEHVTAPLQVLQEAHRILKPGGIFYSICHNREGMLNRILGRRSPIFDIEHLQLFTPFSLHKLAKNAGFSDIRVFPIWNTYPLGYWIKLFPMPMSQKKALIKLLSAAKLDWLPLSAPVGNMGIIAKR